MGSIKDVLYSVGCTSIPIAVAGAILVGTKCQPESPVQPTKKLNVQKEDDITITLSGSQSDGLVSRVSVRLAPRMRMFLSDHVPVSFAVPSISYETPLPVEQGMIGFNVAFPRPYQIDGKRFVIYGHHPATRERKVLFEDVFHYDKKRWY